MRGRPAQVIDVQQLTKKTYRKKFCVSMPAWAKTYLLVFELIAKKMRIYFTSYPYYGTLYL